MRQPNTRAAEQRLRHAYYRTMGIALLGTGSVGALVGLPGTSDPVLQLICFGILGLAVFARLVDCNPKARPYVLWEPTVERTLSIGFAAAVTFVDPTCSLLLVYGALFGLASYPVVQATTQLRQLQRQDPDYPSRVRL